MITFGGFSCIGPDIIVQILRDPNGHYFACADRKHYLESQVDQEGHCLGLTAVV